MFLHNKEELSLPNEHSIPGNILISCGILILATSLSLVFFRIFTENDGIIYLIYIMALIFISKYTNGYRYGIISSLIAVICINWIFTFPYFKINFTLSGYPVTFAFMLAISLITSTMTTHLCKQNEIIQVRELQLREAELEKMRANLLRAVSHDLRTPLTSILGNSSSYLENDTTISDRDKKELVQSIYTDSTWLLNMVENLLTVTRIQGDNLQIITSLEPVEEVVSEALMRLKKRFPNAEVQASVPDEMLFIPMDAILIEQVIINLIENAIIHSGTTKPIELIVEDGLNTISFTIRDYGNGISPNKLPNLFEGGSYSKEEASDTHKGIGIGLSICKTIITAHHGVIHGNNHENGAQFCFLLPKGESQNES